MQQRTVYHHSITILCIMKILHTVLTLQEHEQHTHTPQSSYPTESLPHVVTNNCYVKPKQAGSCGRGIRNEHKNYVKSLICTNIKCYSTNSIYSLWRLYAILLSITKKTARKWKFGIVYDALCSAHKCQLVFFFSVLTAEHRTQPQNALSVARTSHRREPQTVVCSSKLENNGFLRE